jgi:large subunit ribosomal protein L29
MDIKKIREKTIVELKQELLEFQREAFNLRMQKGKGSSTKPHLYKEARKGIARIKTILNEKEGEV